jgi:hypothetical protein
LNSRGHPRRPGRIFAALRHNARPREARSSNAATIRLPPPATVKLYLDGKIDQWFSLQGRSGAAFIWNVTDPVAAREMLEKLPSGQAHLMTFELIPLAPLNPLRQLQGMTTGFPQGAEAARRRASEPAKADAAGSARRAGCRLTSASLFHPGHLA